MDKQIIENSVTGEKYYYSKHKSGIDVYVCEKNCFSSSYAIFGTRYGSVDNAFKTSKNEEYTVVPNGIAHFLEHKLFESEDGDAFERFSKTGASANAYTSFDRTCYLFTCTDNFYESFDILLDFVQKPYFTAETVKKEQGIIGQEIQMYDDSSDWMLMFNLLDCLYYNNPVKINIAGTKETIAKITDKTLYDCYNTFYNPENMFIVVVGNVDVDKVLAMVDDNIRDCNHVVVERAPFNEPYGIVKDTITHDMEVALPQFALGYKIKCPEGGFLTTKDVIETQMLIELICGQQSELYNNLLSKGLVNKGFSGEFMEGRGFAIEIFSGQSSDPNRVIDEIKNEISKIIDNGINKEDFESIKRKYYGQNIMLFNDVEAIGDALTGCACTKTDLFEELDVISNVTIEMLFERMKKQFVNELSAVSLIYPKGAHK